MQAASNIKCKNPEQYIFSSGKTTYQYMCVGDVVKIIVCDDVKNNNNVWKKLRLLHTGAYLEKRGA